MKAKKMNVNPVPKVHPVLADTGEQFQLLHKYEELVSRIEKAGRGTKTITQEEYNKRFRLHVEVMCKLTEAKNGDYADMQDAFANFKQIDSLTNGRVNVADGILVRITDKLKRISSLLQKGRARNVLDERLEDTLLDMAVYSIILKIWLEVQAEA